MKKLGADDIFLVSSHFKQGHCLTLEPRMKKNRSNEDEIFFKTKCNPYTGKPNQQWWYDGKMLTNCANGKALTNNLKKNKLTLTDRTGSVLQLWKYDERKQVIISKANTRVIDLNLSFFGTAKGNCVQLSPFSGKINQKWNVIKLSDYLKGKEKLYSRKESTRKGFVSSTLPTVFRRRTKSTIPSTTVKPVGSSRGKLNKSMTVNKDNGVTAEEVERKKLYLFRIEKYGDRSEVLAVNLSNQLIFIKKDMVKKNSVWYWENGKVICLQNKRVLEYNSETNKIELRSEQKGVMFQQFKFNGFNFLSKFNKAVVMINQFNNLVCKHDGNKHDKNAKFILSPLPMGTIDDLL